MPPPPLAFPAAAGLETEEEAEKETRQLISENPSRAVPRSNEVTPVPGLTAVPDAVQQSCERSPDGESVPASAQMSPPPDASLLKPAMLPSHIGIHAASTTAPIASAKSSLRQSTPTSAIAAGTPFSPTVPPRAASLPVGLPATPNKDTDDDTRARLSTSLVSASASASASPSAPEARPGHHCKPPSRITAWIRTRVSQNKVRFREGGFNLDLTYITPRIVAMGYPAHGTEYYIRNPIDEVERFFDERHAGHFRIYNLCSERAYDNPHRFHGCFRRFPFDDHNAPSLTLILQFVLDAATFLDADESNVVAIHCKAGKGRTGIMVSCLLYYLYPDTFATANEAIHFFDQQRTRDGEGMTIPSQRRYVNYFQRIVREFHGSIPAVQRRLAMKEVTVRVARESTITHPFDLYFIVSDHQHVLLDSRMWFPRGPTVSSAGCIFSFSTLKEGLGPPVILGDVKFAFYRRRPIVLSGKESTACYLWFNTSLCPSLQMVFQRAELDKVDVAAVGKAVTVSLSFAEVKESGAAEASSTAVASGAST